MLTLSADVFPADRADDKNLPKSAEVHCPHRAGAPRRRSLRGFSRTEPADRVATATRPSGANLPDPASIAPGVETNHRAHVDEVTSYGGRGDGRRRAAPPGVVAQTPRRHRGFGTGTPALVARENPSRAATGLRASARPPNLSFSPFFLECASHVSRTPLSPDRPPALHPPGRRRLRVHHGSHA